MCRIRAPRSRHEAGAVGRVRRHRRCRPPSAPDAAALVFARPELRGPRRRADAAPRGRRARAQTASRRFGERGIDQGREQARIIAFDREMRQIDLTQRLARRAAGAASPRAARQDWRAAAAAQRSARIAVHDRLLERALVPQRDAGRDTRRRGGRPGNPQAAVPDTAADRQGRARARPARTGSCRYDRAEAGRRSPAGRRRRHARHGRARTAAARPQREGRKAVQPAIGRQARQARRPAAAARRRCRRRSTVSAHGSRGLRRCSSSAAPRRSRP